MDDEDWEELPQRTAGTIRLCLADEIMYHVMNLKSPGEKGSDLAQHVNVFNQIITDLAHMDNFRSKSRGKKTIHCYKCKESGHMKRDCPDLKRLDDEKRDDSSKSTNVVPNDNSDCSDGDMLSVSTNHFVDAWTPDFGC
ncbi:hypothetical protein Salat_2144000 [Sesamum alatum]|uniref:CCHC-type domain-containing protein n=1 Tax=Sesamum alatum TaxID=300844 RepID=A0AAE1Y2K0_9LAMI|nr:hypothetical protein Salat_2144000 [Sesamum alatum]